MKRNKYSKEFEEEITKLATSYELEKLLSIAINKYKYSITKSQLRQYLYKRGIKYKDYNSNKVHDMGKRIPIGTEYKKPDGMVLVKVSENKWKYKQRIIYENYHNVKLSSDDYIIFLDQNRNNFDINNLKRISRKESSILSNQKMFSKNPKITETGILTAKLIAKAKQCKEELKTYSRGKNMSKSTVYYYKRHRTGLTRSEMANALEVDYERYMLWEQGVLNMPSKYIDKFNEIIHRKKGEHQIERLNHEREVNEWWEEMRQKDERGNYKLNEVARKYNFKTTRELSEKLGFGKNSISFFLSHGTVSYEAKDRMYTFLHNELNIQPPKENKKKNRYTMSTDRKELLKWYNNFDLTNFLQEHNLKQSDIFHNTSIASGTVSALANRKFDNPTTSVLTKLKDYVDRVEKSKDMEEQIDIAEEDIVEEPIVEEDVIEEECEPEEDIEKLKPMIQPMEEKREFLPQIEKTIGRVEVLLAKAKADVLVYEDILKDLKGE